MHRESLWARGPAAAILLVAVVLGLVSGGCGYRFSSGAAPNPSIEIPVLSNETVETAIESVVTESLIQEMRRAPQWRVVPPGRGRYLLSGVITRFYVRPVRVSPSHVAEENRAVLTLKVSLRDKETGRFIWRDVTLREYADYPLGAEVLSSERGRLDAVGRAAERLAKRIRRMVQDTFALGLFSPKTPEGSKTP
jgi:hypothetical protein